jgi:alkylresorcinol/alkylpyrone synthase
MKQSGVRYALAQIAAVAGAHRYAQSALHADFRAQMQGLNATQAQLTSVDKLFQGSEIQSRYLEVSLADLKQQRETHTWHSIVRDAIVQLGARCLAELVSQGAEISKFDALVVVASGYDGLPGPSRRLSEHMGFRTDAVCYDVANLGCGGANHGILLANMLLETQRAQTVCVVCVDLLGTHIHARKYPSFPTVPELVARILPADGAAALVLTSDRALPAHMRFSYDSVALQVHAWPNSVAHTLAATDAAGEPYGRIGKELRDRLLEESTPLLRQAAAEGAALIHGGGIALLRNARGAFPQLAFGADLATTILQNFGNMGAPTILFSLLDFLNGNQPASPKLHLMTFGPGVYSSLVTFDGVQFGA